MADWTEGYVKGIDYTYDCYQELNPAQATLGFLKAGIMPPHQIANACELGFGFGVSANIHAAASQTAWWGTDFNAGQAAFARELAEASGAKAHLFDDSFADFCNRKDLPEFDFIGLHGIWSWVSEENRRIIIDFIRRRLKPGGFVYTSYNTQPGWSQMIPLRHIMSEHAKTMSPSSSPIADRIDASIAFVDDLIKASPAFANLYPLMTGRLNGLRNYNRSYLAHEYFNHDWRPMLFSEIWDCFEQAKLSFACSADYVHLFDHHSLNSVQIEILSRISDVRMRETSRDFVTNRMFRKDFWMKGIRRLSPSEQMAALRKHRVVLISKPADVTSAASGLLSGSVIPDRVFNPLMEILSDLKVFALEEITQRVEPSGINFNEILEAIMILVGKRNVCSVQDDSVVDGSIETSTRLNNYLLKKTGSDSVVSALSSPVTGGGVLVQPTDRRMLLERSRGLSTPYEWADAVWQEYLAKGTRCVRNGQMLLTEEENLAVLREGAEAFDKDVLPRLRVLKVA